MFRYAAVLLALLLTAPLLGSGPAQPGVAPPAARVSDASLLPAGPGPVLTPSYRGAVHGDFLVAGNGVLRCPRDGEDTGGHGVADCRTATTGGGSGGLLDNSGNNNGYFMRHADVDDDPATFDSSTATITVPQGAVVRHAQLTWGGHTGRFIGFAGVNCVRPLLDQGDAPPAPAAAAPVDQAVGIAVGGKPATTVRHGENAFHTNDGLTEPSQVYTAWADVTDAFAGVPTGQPVPVTVGNVWVPTGPGCAGGWSLTVVFDLGHATADYPSPRVVDVYNDDLPQSGVLLPGLLEPLLPGVPPLVDDILPGLASALTGTNARLPGPNPHKSAAAPRLGVTAFDGDFQQGGDTFSVDGEPVVEPCSGNGTSDFFRSCATGALDPADGTTPLVNNLSVDAKTVAPTLADGDSGLIEVGVDTVEDFTVLGSIALSEAVDPSIALTMTGPAQPVTQGGLATFTLTVTNDGGLPLTGVTLRVGKDGDATECVPAHLADLQPGASTVVTCVRAMTEGSGVDVPADVRATYLSGGSGTVTAHATSHVDVVPADLALTRIPDTLVTRAGATVTFAVTLHNTTDSPLSGIGYTDGAAPECAAPATTLAAGATMSFDCEVVAPDTAFQSNGTAQASTVDGQVLTVTSDVVQVDIIAPALTVTTAVDPDTIYRGGQTKLTFTVTNTGDVADEALTDVKVTADKLCTAPVIPALGPGEQATTTCTAAPTESGDVTATAKATDVTGEPVTATAAPVPVTVLEPTITLTQQVDKPMIRLGGEVELTFTVENTGTAEDGSVRDVRITSPTLPPDCAPAPIDELGPGQSATTSCTAKPDRTFDNQAFAAGVDQFDRVMRVGTDPQRVVVTNPALTITTAAEPGTAKHNEPVDFVVTVRNIGDVPLTVAVTNDSAPDCDATLTGDGLPAGAANGVRCTVSTPPDESTTELTDVATYQANPRTADDGPALTGSDKATVRLEAGQAVPEPQAGDDPANPGAGTGGGTGGTSGTGGSGGGAPADQASGGPSKLAWTGWNVVAYVGIGMVLLALGGFLLLTTSRRRDNPDSALYRWWPGGRD